MIYLIQTLKNQIIQRFIQENPVLLHQFPAEEIFFKPPILTLYKADFGILTPNKEFILIELEKTTTKLIKKDGGMHSNLNHAFDQIREWQDVISDHKIAVLESLKIDKSKVTSISGVIIAGRDSQYDPHLLRRLKGSDYGKTTLLGGKKGTGSFCPLLSL